MPSNIEDSNSVSYDGDTLNGITAAGIDLAEGLMTDVQLNEPSSWSSDITHIVTQAADKSGLGIVPARDLIIKQLAAQAVNVFGANVSINSLLARSGGKIFNPNMELLFNNVTLRTFRFTFKMTPRDENEATAVKSIIRSLKKNMAAKRVAPIEGSSTENSGLFLKTPNIFELTYMKGNKKHPFLNRFKPAALSDMSVNYTGDNVYATYGDGTPVSMILNLTFKELVPVYEDDYTDSALDEGYQANTFSDNDLVYGVNGQPPNAEQKDVEGVGY